MSTKYDKEVKAIEEEISKLIGRLYRLDKFSKVSSIDVRDKLIEAIKLLEVVERRVV